MILSTFYEAIMARLTTKIPEIKHFDMYFGQYESDNEELSLPFPRPAVLFEYDPQEWGSTGNKKQSSDASFSLHVLSDVPQEISKSTDVQIRNLGHEHLQMLDNVFYHLQGFNGPGFGSISRTGLLPYGAQGLLMVHILRFKTRLTDDAAIHPKTSVSNPTLIIKTTP
jgi:hypothetical protein